MDVDGETDGVDPLVSEVVVPCPLCRVTTSKDDLVDNHFLQYENDDNDENDVATHLCQVWPLRRSAKNAIGLFATTFQSMMTNSN